MTDEFATLRSYYDDSMYTSDWIQNIQYLLITKFGLGSLKFSGSEINLVAIF